jgi:hypothetical protein
MNSIMNHRSVIVSTVVIVVALLCALFVGALLIHDSMHETHLVRHGIMIIQAYMQVV